MRTVFSIIFFVLFVQLFAQSPEFMSYQAVLRDVTGQLLSNQGIGVQVSILQGSVSGTSVYTETHSLQSNANGLLTLEIGAGNTTGDFSAINWSAGPYFIQTEIDPTQAGGSSYSIAAVSQLLSVPYALHAKTAETITGTISETDPVYTSSQAANISSADIINLGNLSGVNTGDQDLSGIATNTQAIQDTANQIRADIPDISGFVSTETDPVYTSSQASNISSADITNLGNLSGVNTGDQDLSALVTKTALSDSIAQVRSEIPAIQFYSVGDFAQGGIVFWVDETGQHGLVCAKEDQSDSTRWYAGTTCDTHAKGSGPYSGEMNTMLIIATQTAIGDDGDTYAARICNELEITEGGITYGDWYLPSIGEAFLMQQNRAVINATALVNGGAAFESGTYYWSSTEISSSMVHIIPLSTTTMCTSSKLATSRSVRAIRAF
jgi:hypothetical protein